MTRAVYVGGFGNGFSSAERVGHELAEHYKDVDVYTFSEAMGNSQNSLRRAVQGADRVVTLSAGFMALTKDMMPKFVSAFSAPVDTSVQHLLTATAIKTARMHAPLFDIESAGTMRPVFDYDRSALAELALRPFGNLRHLKRIADFDAICAASDMNASDIPTELIYADRDDYFRINDTDARWADYLNVPLYMTEGQHDELVLRPENMIAYMFDETREPLVASVV